MDVRKLRIFVAVCQCNCMTKAAQTLYISQPAVSFAIKELEKFYGVQLFDRISKKIHLTTDGKKLLCYAESISALYDEAERTLKSRDAIPEIRIGCSIAIGAHYMATLAKSLIEKNFKVCPKILINNTSIIEEKLLTNELDIALFDGFPQSPNIIAQQFSTGHLTFVCANSHPFSNRNDVKLNSILEENFLLREQGSCVRDLIDTTFRANKISVEPVWESVSTLALVNAVSENLGISILPMEFIKTALSHGKIACFSSPSLEFSRPFSFAFHKQKHLTPIMYQFMDIATSSINDQRMRGDE